LVFG